MKSAQVHRFRDHVAIYIGGGETAYMSVKDARRVSAAINKVARSIVRESFVDSPPLTTYFDFKDMRESR